MVESGAKEITEEVVVGAIDSLTPRSRNLRRHRGAGEGCRQDEAHCVALEDTSAYAAELMGKVGDRLKDALDTKKNPKFESYAKIKEIKDELKKTLPEGDAAAAKSFPRSTKACARASSASRC